jgi:hypothetical protein
MVVGDSWSTVRPLVGTRPDPRDAAVPSAGDRPAATPGWDPAGAGGCSASARAHAGRRRPAGRPAGGAVGPTGPPGPARPRRSSGRHRPAPPAQRRAAPAGGRPGLRRPAVVAVADALAGHGDDDTLPLRCPHCSPSGTRRGRPWPAACSSRPDDGPQPRGGGMTTGAVADVLEVRRGAYYDSVTLMLVSGTCWPSTGVGGPGRDGHRAQPRPAARHGLRDAGRRRDRTTWWSRCGRRTETPADRALAALEQALAAASAGSAGGDGLGGDGPAPRTVASAARRTGGADLGPSSRSPARTPSPRRWTRSARACRCWSSATTCRSRPRCGSRTKPAARGLL